MVRLRTILALFVVTGLALFATNPGPADLREHVTKLMNAEIDKETPSLGPEAAALLRMAVPLIASQVTIEHRNYGVISVFKLGVTVADGPGPRIPECFLGVARQFVELRRC